MHIVSYRNRRAAEVENSVLHITVTTEGGHVAEIAHKKTGVNPLWTPPWASVEPSAYDPVLHPEYGSDKEAQLLSGILGHNICLDTFGTPSPEEAAAGMPVHGEAPIAPYSVSGGSDWIETEAHLPKAQLRFKRRISLAPDSSVVRFSEELENLSPSDRPVGWTQHVTLGPPFLGKGSTQFRASATRSQVIDSDFNDGKGLQQRAAIFDWPLCPLKDGRTSDLRVFTDEPVSGGFTAHLMNPEEEHAWFMAWCPNTKILFGYIWKRSDFPWLARWEENHLRTQTPWNGKALTCGMEFGVSPFVGSRREMVERGPLFETPTFRWVPARTRLQVDYCAFITTRECIPEFVHWDGGWNISFGR